MTTSGENHGAAQGVNGLGRSENPPAGHLYPRSLSTAPLRPARNLFFQSSPAQIRSPSYVHTSHIRCERVSASSAMIIVDETLKASLKDLPPPYTDSMQRAANAHASGSSTLTRPPRRLPPTPTGRQSQARSSSDFVSSPGGSSTSADFNPYAAYAADSVANGSARRSGRHESPTRSANLALPAPPANGRPHSAGQVQTQAWPRAPGDYSPPHPLSPSRRHSHSQSPPLPSPTGGGSNPFDAAALNSNDLTRPRPLGTERPRSGSHAETERRRMSRANPDTPSGAGPRRLSQQTPAFRREGSFPEGMVELRTTMLAATPQMRNQTNEERELEEGRRYEQQLLARCAAGDHAPKYHYGPAGIISSVLLFPVGLICLVVDREKRCARCNEKIHGRRLQRPPPQSVQQRPRQRRAGQNDSEGEIVQGDTTPTVPTLSTDLQRGRISPGSRRTAVQPSDVPTLPPIAGSVEAGEDGRASPLLTPLDPPSVHPLHTLSATGSSISLSMGPPAISGKSRRASGSSTARASSSQPTESFASPRSADAVSVAPTTTDATSITGSGTIGIGLGVALAPATAAVTAFVAVPEPARVASGGATA